MKVFGIQCGYSSIQKSIEMSHVRFAWFSSSYAIQRKPNIVQMPHLNFICICPVQRSSSLTHLTDPRSQNQ